MKIDAYIEIVGSTNPRMNTMASSSQISVMQALSGRYSQVRITTVNTFADLKKLVAKKPDLVVLGMKVVPLDESVSFNDSPKLWLSDYLQEHDIAFAGSPMEALELQFDKNVAKQKVLDASLKSSKYFVSRITDPIVEHTLQFPLFVKPTNRGGSRGIDDRSVVHSADQLHAKIRSVHIDDKSDALVEEYLPGREFSVAVVRHANSERMFALPVEVVIPANVHGDSFLSKAIKHADSEKVIAVADGDLKDRISHLAIGAFEALGSRDYGRIDMRLDASGHPTFMEANLMPGLSNHGYLSRCFMLNNQTSYDDMITSIVGLGLERVST